MTGGAKAAQALLWHLDVNTTLQACAHSTKKTGWQHEDKRLEAIALSISEAVKWGTAPKIMT